MNLVHLRYFMEVANSLSISKAADALFISQPALSRTIKAFEDSLGVRLFTRTNKGLTLTPAGMILREEAGQFFSSERILMEKLHAATDEDHLPLKIMYSLDTFSDKLNRFSLYYNQTYGPQKFIIERGSWAAIRSEFRHGLADIAVCLELVFKDVPGINSLTISESQDCILLAKNHPLCEKKEITLKDISSLTYISHNRAGTGDALQLETVLNAAGFDMVPILEHNNSDAVMIAVALGHGFSVLSEKLFSDKYKDVLQIIPCPELGKDRFVVAWPRSIESPDLLKVVKRMAEYNWF